MEQCWRQSFSFLLFLIGRQTEMTSKTHKLDFGLVILRLIKHGRKSWRNTWKWRRSLNTNGHIQKLFVFSCVAGVDVNLPWLDSVGGTPGSMRKSRSVLTVSPNNVSHHTYYISVDNSQAGVYDEEWMDNLKDNVELGLLPKGKKKSAHQYLSALGSLQSGRFF